MTVTTNGVGSDQEWYDPIVTAAKLGMSGPQLRNLRFDGGLPDDAWRQVTKGKRRSIEYRASAIDLMALIQNNGNDAGSAAVTDTDTTEAAPPSAVYRENLRDHGHLIPPAELVLEPLATECLAVIGKLGPIVSEDGRTRTVLHALLPNGPSYGDASVSGATGMLAKCALITRETKGKRTYRISITSRGRKWLTAHRSEVPYVPDHGHGQVVASNTAAVVEPEAADEPVTVDVGPVKVNDAPLDPEPQPEPEPEPEPEPADDRADIVDRPLVDDVEADTEAVMARLREDVPVPGHPAVPDAPVPAPSPVSEAGIARSLLQQVVAIASDGNYMAVSAERDALRAHNAALVEHNALLRQRAEAAELAARESAKVLHTIEAALTPLLVGRDARLDVLDPETRTKLIALLGEAVAWSQ